MTTSKSSLVHLLGAALAGLVPGLLAIPLASDTRILLSAAGAAIAMTSFLVIALRCTHALGVAEERDQQLQSVVITLEREVVRLEAKARDTAALDEVSGVFNRRTFLARLDEAVHRDTRLEQPMAVLLIDIDGFRMINADAGRAAGDAVLRAVGRAVQSATRGTDFVGRVGGDEFAVVLGECADPRPVVRRVFVALAGETTGGDKPLPLRVSVGAVTIAEPQAGVDTLELFRAAEAALRSVRADGGGHCVERQYRVDNRRPVQA